MPDQIRKYILEFPGGNKTEPADIPELVTAFDFSGADLEKVLDMNVGGSITFNHSVLDGKYPTLFIRRVQ